MDVHKRNHPRLYDDDGDVLGGGSGVEHHQYPNTPKMLKIHTDISPLHRLNSGSAPWWVMSPRVAPRGSFHGWLAVAWRRLSSLWSNAWNNDTFSSRVGGINLGAAKQMHRSRRLPAMVFGARPVHGLMSLSRRVVTMLFVLLLLLVLLANQFRAKKDKLLCSLFKGKKKELADSQGFMTPFEPYSKAFASMSFEQPALPGTRNNWFACVNAIQIEQIGLLFLAHGRIKNEHTWKMWFDAARGKIPLGVGKLHRCLVDMEFEERIDIRSICGIADRGAEDDVIGSQLLFDVWVHLKKGESPDIFERSIFKDRLIPDENSVDATWGGHSLIDATRVLFAASLANPLVSKLILVSDSDVPLYGPTLVYNQLLSESKSRINACNTTAGWDRNEYRLRRDFLDQGISWETWRKSWQWIALKRSHASLVLRDTEIDAIFRSLCRARWDHDWCDFRVCYSDEHYIPTLLAMHGLDNETDCVGELTHKDWSRVKSTDPHPYEYRPTEISPELFSTLRNSKTIGCERSAMIQSGLSKLFITIEAFYGNSGIRHDTNTDRAVQEANVCERVREATYARLPSFVPLAPQCPLLARKFSDETQDAVVSIAPWIFGMDLAEP
jgi:hypothetical protein